MTGLKLIGNTSTKNRHKAAKKRGQGGKKRRGIKIIGVVLGVLLIAVLAYMIWDTPPSRATEGLATHTTNPAESAAPDENENTKPTETPVGSISHNGDMYTFLIVGKDKVAGNTDTMLVGSLNTETHEMNVVSIPRDTLVNTPGSIKKVNTLYDYDLNSGGNGVDGLQDGIKDLIGFSVDCYAVVDLTAFEKLVDAIGGVYYDVPVDMYYNDPTQNLNISIAAGYQLLDGENALKVVRFREGYADADIGRIRTQQDFLKTVAKQMLKVGNIPNLTKLIDIFTEYVDTDLSSGNLSFFAREFLLCDSEDVNFYTLPGNYTDSVGGFSYVSLDLDEWLDMVNEYLNPWSTDVTEKNVNILTRDESGALYSTTGVIAGGEDSFLTMEEYLASLG